MLKHDLIKHLEFRLEKAFNLSIELSAISKIGGGDINEAFQLTFNDSTYFLKLNSSINFPKMFEAEYRGLEMLRKSSSFIIPRAYFYGDFEENSYLLMEWLDLSANGDWTNFGRVLANLHKKTDQNFGLDHDNYIGSLIQLNSQTESWSEFYANQRLLPLFRQAFDLNYFDADDQNKLQRLLNNVDNIYPKEVPSFIHGDLWSGNASFCKTIPTLYDPAVYFGHREMDLAMTLLFGGFPKEMYDAYNEVYPLEIKWKERVEINQLYPLLVHVLLFGGSYVRQVKNILKRF